MWRKSGESAGSWQDASTDGVWKDSLQSDCRTTFAIDPSKTPVADAGQLRMLWLSVARQLCLSQSSIEECLERVARNGSSLPAEILASRGVAEAEFYRKLGDAIGVAVCFKLEPARLQLNARQAAMLLGCANDYYPIRYTGDTGACIYLTSPHPGRLEDLVNQIASYPGLRQRLVLVPRSIMRLALSEIARPALIAKSRDSLFLTAPTLSARTRVNGWQGVLFGSLLIALPIGLALQKTDTLLVIHLVASLFFLSGVVLRVTAIRETPKKRVPRVDEHTQVVPVYSVLVALRNEAAVVPELLVSLGKLRWPRSRLEVKFICEADDRVTIDAIKAGGLRPWVEVIEVPAGMVKTKPNALNFALPQTSGEFVVLYDAEDRPAPDQLIEAWRRFRASDPQLGCLQAPLRIDNWNMGLLPRMFALEYASLFLRILPMLGRHELVMPLGGTSNHFRGLR